MTPTDSKAMEKIVVITGGAGGMGLATAKIVGQEYRVVISDINQQRLDKAVEELNHLGINCDSAVCDIADRSSVDTMVSRINAMGTIKSVIHTAGISPQMAEPEIILKVNALGTIHITEAFLKIAKEGFALVNVSSNSAHLLPGWIIPTRAFRIAETDPQRFVKKIASRCRLLGRDEIRQRGSAYAISKNFVIWYSKKSAAKFGDKGARIVSVSPGTFDTEMGKLEEKSGALEFMKLSALKRLGRPEEIAEVLAFCASDKAGYLTGTDVLCDGGAIASKIK